MEFLDTVCRMIPLDGYEALQRHAFQDGLPPTFSLSDGFPPLLFTFSNFSDSGPPLLVRGEGFTSVCPDLGSTLLYLEVAVLVLWKRSTLSHYHAERSRVGVTSLVPDDLPDLALHHSLVAVSSYFSFLGESTFSLFGQVLIEWWYYFCL